MLKYEVEILIGIVAMRHYRYGSAHRINLPSTICKNGNRYWYQYGDRHRKDGPAIIQNEYEAYYIRGHRIK